MRGLPFADPPHGAEAVAAGTAAERAKTECAHSHINQVGSVRRARVVPAATGAKGLLELGFVILFYVRRYFIHAFDFVVFLLVVLFVFRLPFAIFRHSSTVRTTFLKVLIQYCRYSTVLMTATIFPRKG